MLQVSCIDQNQQQNFHDKSDVRKAMNFSMTSTGVITSLRIGPLLRDQKYLFNL